MATMKRKWGHYDSAHCYERYESYGKGHWSGERPLQRHWAITKPSHRYREKAPESTCHYESTVGRHRSLIIESAARRPQKQYKSTVRRYQKTMITTEILWERFGSL
jgi:hypothetical protein